MDRIVEPEHRVKATNWRLTVGLFLIDAAAVVALWGAVWLVAR